MPDLASHYWTREDLARLPDDGNRYEVLDGELLVTPMPVPLHQWLASSLARMLGSYLEAQGLGVALGPSAVVWSRNELQPDVAVLPVQPDALRGQRWEDLPMPLLVIEVLSPSTRSRDRGRKRAAYQALGIPAYWMVDPETNRVTMALADGSEHEVDDQLEWSPAEATAPFVLPLRTLFG